MRKTIYTGKLPTSKRRTRTYFLVFFLDTKTNYTRNKNQKGTGNGFAFSQSFSNTQEESKKINLRMDDIMEKCEHR